MSCAKQSPRSRSFAIVESGARAPVRDGRGALRSSRTIPAMVTWLALETLARFTVDVARAAAELLLAGLSWLLSEFLAGCAAYAEAMYPVSIPIGNRDRYADQTRPALPPVTTRPRLFLVSDTTHDNQGPHDLPRQVAASSRTANRDPTARELDIVRGSRTQAARRKNRPR